MTTVSKMAGSLIGSEVLRIAAEINKLKAEGKAITNFTVGDFDPKHFPIPSELREAIVQAYEAQQTNYPPSSGIAELRESVAKFYSTRLGVPTKSSEVLVAGGARPLIYTIFTAFCDAGDKVVYPVPSWNNNHYCHLVGARGVPVTCKAEKGFLPTAEDLAPHLRDARLLCLNSPLNPCGSTFEESELRRICEAVLAENARPERKNRPLYMMYDQIYWMLTHNGVRHHDPVSLVPAMKPYTVFVDGLSKYFCATGIRVGWSVLPESLMGTFSAILGHIGAWAPKPEQIATARYLDRADISSFVRDANAKLQKRLIPLYEGVLKMKAEGLPVDALRPDGGIYLSLHLRPKGLATNEEIRKSVLHEAGVALIPFQAFGVREDEGWFRLSMGAVAEADIPTALESLAKYLKTRA